MTKEMILEEAMNLSEHDRIVLASELLSGVPFEEDMPAITDAEMDELNRKRQHILDHPEDLIPWEEAKKMLWQSIRK